MTSASPINAQGNGADDTAAIQNGLNTSGIDTFIIPPIAGGYTTGPLTIPANVHRLIFEVGAELKQRADNETIFTGSGITDLLVHNPTITGRAVNAAVGSNNLADSAFKFLANCSDIRLVGGEIKKFRCNAVYAEQSKNVSVRRLRSLLNGHHLRFRGVNGVEVYRVTIDGMPYVPVGLVNGVNVLASQEFCTGIGFDSTDNHSLGLCSNINVCKNLISNLGDSQGVLHHGGSTYTYDDNVFRNCSISISLNPYNTSDFIDYGQITSNKVFGLDVQYYVPGGIRDHGIVVNAGPASYEPYPATPDINEPVVAENIVVGVNRQRLDYTVGAYLFHHVRGLNMPGNSALSCGVNGAVFAGAMTAMNVVGFTSRNNTLGGGEKNAIRLLGTSISGAIDNVVSDGNTVGLRTNGLTGYSVGQITMVNGGSPVY